MKILGVDLGLKYIIFLTPDGKEHDIIFRQSWRRGIYEVVDFDGVGEGLKIVAAYPSVWGGIGQAAETLLPYAWAKMKAWLTRIR